MRLDGEVENHRSGIADARSALEDALALAVRIEQLLSEAAPRCPENDAFRVRLARAHTLGLVDQLSELTGTRSSAAPPRPSGIWPSAAELDGDDEETVRTGARRTWR